MVLAEANNNVVVRAMSERAKQWGVTAGQTVTSARSLCPELIVLSYDQAAYETAARLVWNALAVLSDTVEPVSPEVCFLTLSEKHAERDATLLASRLARAIGCPVRVGIGRSKLVAERAAYAAADDKGAPVLVQVGEEAALLASLPIARVADLPRRVTGRIKLDRRQLLRLERFGIRTLGDALSLSRNCFPRVLRPVAQL